MALVNYSDSDDSDDDQSQLTKSKAQTGSQSAPHSLKRKQIDNQNSSLPPLPDSFHDLYPTAKRKSNQDDPHLHSGRQRLTPHVEGNWPTHIYIEWYPQKDETERLLNILSGINHAPECSAPVHSLVRSELGENLPLHISLSRPITLTTHQRQSFIDRLILEVSRISIRPFEISTHDLDWVGNNENTRWFLVMRIKKPPNNELNRLLQSANDTVMAFGQSPLYTQPESQSSIPTQGFTTKSQHPKPKLPPKKPPFVSPTPTPTIDQSSNFHISIGWSLSPPSAEKSSTSTPSHQPHLAAQHCSPEFHFQVKAVKLKIGNSVTSISLPSKPETGSGIF